MSFTITCPYCFKQMNDDEVMFRSELFHRGDPDCIPDDYEDFEDFQKRYHGDDKDAILTECKAWYFFAEGEDPVYTEFWAKYNGTTENNPADAILGIKAYLRKVIDPYDTSHQRYLVGQGDGTTPFIRDAQGMVSQIELYNGDHCNRRVCRYCHNPLPDNYGKNPVRFVTLIGITGSGKTVFLSQLLKNMSKYSVKAGLTSMVTNASVRNFLDNNGVAAGKPLPGSTPESQLQQPLFYDMLRKDEMGNVITETFVLYDVAGEIFKEEKKDLIPRFAPFIQHAHGCIVLIDPIQFPAVQMLKPGDNKRDNPTTAIQAIHNIVTSGNGSCEIPFAICISKSDDRDVQSVLPQEIRGTILQEVNGIKDHQGFFTTVFNAAEYFPIGANLFDFMQMHVPDFAQYLNTNYKNYSYFAFSALGCPVAEQENEYGTKVRVPIGPVLPKRLEEPLLWMFYKLGYVARNAHLPLEHYCPNCDYNEVVILPPGTVIPGGKKLFKKLPDIPVNRACRCCGYQWWEEQ